VDLNLDRIGRWVLVTFAAAVPPGLACLYFSVDGKSPWTALAEAPEIGFTALMLSATSWSELREARTRIPELTLALGEYVLIVLACTSAVFYGIHSKSLYLDPAEESFRSFLSNITISLAVVAMVVGSIYQLLIARIEGDHYA
jgi:hypothetical protein